MAVKVAINGFGRIGRLAFRQMFGAEGYEVVAINDLTSPKMLAYLLKYDSSQGKYAHADTVEAGEDYITVNGKKITIYKEPDASKLPWGELDVDVVLECTGFYTSAEKSQAHIDAGAKRVLISAPAGNIPTVVPGVNLDTLTKDDIIVSAGSCTTSCLAPMAKVLNDEFGVKVGTMTTIHAFTSTQAILDGPRGKKMRNNRTASVNTIPHSSGAAKAIGLVIPELNGKLSGHAQRVGVVDGSLTELVSILDKKVTVDQINDAMKKATNPAFGYTEDEIVSTDIIGSTYGSVFDPSQTEIMEGDDGSQLVKTVAWYDNEYGFTSNMIRTLLHFATL